MMTHVVTYLKGFCNAARRLMTFSRISDVHCPTCARRDAGE